MKGSADYRGPGDDFPYMGFQILGATHLLLGVAMEVLGIVHLGLGANDRMFALNTGSVAVWCPMAAIATGILGVLIQKNRYWEVRCIKEAFLGMCLITGMVFMVALGVVTGLIDFYQYDVLRQWGAEFHPAEKLAQPVPADDNRLAMVWLIMALAALEFLVCMVSACVCCCCAPLYREDTSTPQQQIIVKQEPPPPVYVEKPAPTKTIVVEKPVAQPQQQIVLRPAAQPTPRPVIVQQAQPQVIYQSLPPPRPMLMAAPPPRPMMMAGPPPRPMMMGPPPMMMRPPLPAPMYPSMRGMPNRIF